MAEIKIKGVDDSLNRAVVQAIIEERGHSVDFVVNRGLVLCTTCEGSDPFCATCNGNQYIYSEETITLTCGVRWKKEDQVQRAPFGRYFVGDCQLVTFYNPGKEDGLTLQELGTDYIIDNMLFALVDNKRLVKRSSHREGKPTNRVYIDCDEDANIKTDSE